MDTTEILTLTIVLAAVFSYVNHRFLKWPPVIGIAALSLVFSIVLSLGISPLSQKAMLLAGSVDFQDLLMNFMLSFLLFAGAMHIDGAGLKKERWPVILLATTATILSTFIVGGFIFYIFRIFHTTVPFIHCLLFGALISPTDPIALLSILRQAGIPSSLELKIAGESLFNDGVAVVIFTVLVRLARSGGMEVSALSVARLFLQEAAGGLAFGAALGYLGFLAIRSIDDYKIEVMITLAIVMGGYYLAGHLHISGPLAMVVAGLITGNKVAKEAVSEISRDYLHKFWELIDDILNAVLFLFIGLMMLVIDIRTSPLLVGLIAIVVCLLARYISISLPVLALRKRLQFEKNAITILTWGGLRGGISIAMALSLGSEMHRSEFVTITYVIVIFSILVQGLTIGRLARRLLVLLIFIIPCTFHGYAQTPKQTDSIRIDSSHKDSTHTAENLLLEQHKRAQLDSVLLTQLRIELRDATGNQTRTKELQTQLNRILEADSARKAGQLQRIETLKKNAKGFPVVLDNDTLFFLFTKTGSFTADERASAISQRIAKLYHDYSFTPDSLTIQKTENGYDILYKDNRTIMSIAQLDALWFETAADSLAQKYRSIIAGQIMKEQKANSLNNWLKRLGLVALILLGFALFIFALNKLFLRTGRLIGKKKERFARILTFRKYHLVSPEKFQQLADRGISLLKIILIIIAGYIALLLISGIFTATEKWTDTLLRWILTPARSVLRGFIHFLPDLFTIVVIFTIFRFIVKGIKYLSEEIEKGRMTIKGFHEDWARPTFNIVKFLLYAFMLVLVFPYLPGSSSPAFKGVSVFLGVLISLGSSSAINNMVAGLVITYMRPFKVGDRVKIGDITGDVLEKTMLVTRIRTIKNEDITVPNSTILSASSINYSSNTGPEDTGLILHTTVTIGYDTPWKQMHAALIEAAKRTEDLLPAPEPFVLQTSLDDFYISYQLNVYTKEANKQATIYSQLHQNIQDVCSEMNIEIMSPHYRAMRDGNASTIPPLEKD